MNETTYTRADFIKEHKELIDAVLAAWQENTPDGPSRMDESTAESAFCNACFWGRVPDGDELDVQSALCAAATGSPSFADPVTRRAADRFYSILRPEYLRCEEIRGAAE